MLWSAFPSRPSRSCPRSGCRVPGSLGRLVCAAPSLSPLPQLPGVTSRLPSCGLPGRPSSGFRCLCSPRLLARPPSVGPTRLYWHPQTPSQLIFSFVFSRRRLERTEGIRLASGCAYLTVCYQRKEGNWLLECLCALSARGVRGTVPHPACSALTAVDGRALPGGCTRGGRLLEGGRVPGHRETRRSAAC